MENITVRINRYKCAGIVTYNPDMERLCENIESILSQVDQLIIVDNGSINIQQIVDSYGQLGKISLICNSENEGIAYALNQIINRADWLGYEWVLLLDQDSVVPSDILNAYSKCKITNTRTAVLCPNIYDNNSKQLDTDVRGDIEIGVCITSGSLVNLSICRILGGFDSELFIDSVDTDYSIKIFLSGYNIIRVSNVILNHQVGNIVRHTYKAASNHSAKRRYYIARNSIFVALYYNKVLRRIGVNSLKRQNIDIFLDHHTQPSYALLRQIQFIIIITMYEKQKLDKIKSIIRGLYDGIMRYRKCDVREDYNPSNINKI